MEHICTFLKSSIRSIALGLVSILILSGCAIELSLEELSSSVASSLKWDQVALQSSGDLQAKWEAPTNEKIVQQELLYYKGAHCEDPILPTIQLGADAGSNTAAFNKDEGEQYTFRVYSMDITGKVTSSDCSSPVTYQDSFAVSITAAGGKVNEANVASAPFAGRCAQGSTIQVSAPSAANILTFPCAANGTWTRGIDLSPVAGVYAGDVTFTVTPSGGGSPKAYTVTIDKDSVPPTIDIPSVSGITAANQSAYTLNGTCSENGETVNISIGSIDTTATCSAGTYSKTLDVSSLTGNTISISATHKDTYNNTRSKFVITTRYVSVPTITSVSLNSGAAATNSLSATLNMNVTGATQMYITNTPGCSSGGSWETFASSKTWTLPTANSTNTVYVKFKESHDNETSCASDDILHDNIDPTVSITSPVAASYVNGGNVSSFTISGACSENGRSITISGPGAFSATTTCSGTAYSAILDLTALSQGSFQLTASINDAAGNTGTGTSPSYTKDTVVPTGSVAINGGALATTSLTSTLTLTSSDTGGQMYVTNTSGCASGGTWEAFAASKSWTLAAANSTNTVYSKFRDAAGNESSCYSDSIDHTSSTPTVTISSPASGTYINIANSSAFTISGACSENGNAVTLTSAGLTISDATCSSGTWSKTIDTSSLADGSISFTANHSSSSAIAAPAATQSYSKDTAAPSVTNFVIKNNDAYTGTLTNTLTIASATATDMYITNNALCLTGGSWETFATSKSWTLSTADTTNTVYIKTRDVAGNESSCISDSITHDGSVATLAWTSPDASSYINSINASTFAISGTCSLEGRPVSIAVYLGATNQNMPASTTCTSGIWSTNLNFTSKGDTTYEVRATHTSLGGSTVTVNRSFIKDTIAPSTATIAGAPSGTNGTATLNITIAGTNVTHYRYFVVPPSASELCTNSAAYTGSDIPIATKITDTLTESGAYKVCVLGRDVAGNYSAASAQSTWTRDGTGPVPQLVTSTKANGTYGATEVINVRVTFNENITVTGTPYLALATGSTIRNATYVSTSTTNMNFTYTVQTGDSAADLDYTTDATIVLNGGTIRDSYTNNATLTLPAAGSANSLAGQKDLVITAPNPVAVLSGAPSGTSTATSLAVTVSGSGVTYYKKAIISSGTCATATYSSQISVATAISDSVYTQPDGLLTLCVIARDAANVWQDVNSATSASWYKDSLKPVSITSPAVNRVDEGSALQNITVSIPTAKTYDFNVKYKVTGDAVNGTNYNLTDGTLTFTAGTTSLNIPVTFPNNATADGERVLNVHLLSTDGVTTNLGTRYQAQYFIADDEKNLTVTTMAMNRVHACAIMSDSSLRCWGHNTNGKLGDGTNKFKDTAITIALGTTFKSVAVGYTHTCAVTTSGGMYCWGNNAANQIGDNTTTQRMSPTLIDSPILYQAVTAGENHTCGLTTSNKIRCWGQSDFGQVGTGATGTYAIPQDVDNANDYKSVVAGSKSTCGITTGHKLRCWGRNTSYSLGDGTNTNQLSPVDIDAAANYASVAMGSQHACGILMSGGLRCWGTNANGALGDGTVTDRTTPVDINAGETYTKVTVNDDTTAASSRGFGCAVTTSNILHCWGDNSAYQLADGTSTAHNIPAVADAGTSYSQIYSNLVRACGVTTSGALKCWGNLATDTVRNISLWGGGLGNAYATYGGFTPLFTDWSFGTNVGLSTAYVSETGTQVCGIQANKLYCWGTSAVFGDDSRTDVRRPAPVLIDPTTNYAILPTRHDGADNCAITTTGDLKCWGVNNYGELGTSVPVGQTAWTPVSVDPGYQYAQVALMSSGICGVTTTGELRCAGGNTNGQLGNGTTTNLTTYTTIDAGTSYKFIDRAAMNSCGLTTAGVVKCWGFNIVGSFGDGSTSSSSTPVIADGGATYKKISFSTSTGCGITTSDKLRCWGQGSTGMIPDNTGANRPTPVTIDSANTYVDVSLAAINGCAVKTGGQLRCWGDPITFGLIPVNENTNGTNFYNIYDVDVGTTYTGTTVGSNLVCGYTGGGLKCMGRGNGRSLGVVDAGLSNGAISSGLPTLQAPVYLHKWLNY